MGMTMTPERFDIFVRTLQSCPLTTVVEGLAAAFDSKELNQIATELDELLRYLLRDRTPEDLDVKW
jgi:hypothetical protein